MLLIFFLIFARKTSPYLVPPVTDIRTNENAFDHENTTCFNPIGFYQNKAIECENFSSSNPTVGLVMSHINDLNLFALLYFSMKIKKENI